MPGDTKLTKLSSQVCQQGAEESEAFIVQSTSRIGRYRFAPSPSSLSVDRPSNGQERRLNFNLNLYFVLPAFVSQLPCSLSYSKTLLYNPLTPLGLRYYLF
jgi:hypothetical protein